MGTLGFFSVVLSAAISAWLIYGYVKRHPEQFTGKALSDSFWTLGLLALALLVVLGLFVVMLRN